MAFTTRAAAFLLSMTVLTAGVARADVTINGQTVTSNSPSDLTALAPVSDYTQLSLADLQSHIAQGDKRAKFHLAMRTLKGTGVAMDTTTAFRLFKELADEGFVEAQLNVGRMYAQGKGVARNLFSARTYLAEPARQGDSRAIFMLADIEEQTKTSLAEAYALYKTAAQDNALAAGVRSVAQEKVTKLAMLLPEGMRQAAEAKTRQWLSSGSKPSSVTLQ